MWGRRLDYEYLVWIYNHAVRLGLKGTTFFNSDGSIKIVAEGEEKNLMEFANNLEGESNYRDIENFYTKWVEPNKNLESFYVVTN